jgi:hypothetical protein
LGILELPPQATPRSLFPTRPVGIQPPFKLLRYGAEA